MTIPNYMLYIKTFHSLSLYKGVSISHDFSTSSTMPHIDLEAIINRAGSGGDGRRVACETILNADIPHSESICLSKDEAIDNWFGRSANVYYERKESTKGNANSNPNSQRLILTSKSKPSIIGLPKPQTSTFHDRRPVKPGKTGFFPKRLGSAGKFSLRLSEPSSPRVSCMGRVRSKNRCRSGKSSTAASSKPQKTGFWARFGSVFRFSRGKSRPAGDDGQKSESWSKRQNEAKVEVVNPPGLGGMNRFVSGRRSDAWAGDALNVEKVQEGD